MYTGLSITLVKRCLSLTTLTLTLTTVSLETTCGDWTSTSTHNRLKMFPPVPAEVVTEEARGKFELWALTSGNRCPSSITLLQCQWRLSGEPGLSPLPSDNEVLPSTPLSGINGSHVWSLDFYSHLTVMRHCSLLTAVSVEY